MTLLERLVALYNRHQTEVQSEAVNAMFKTIPKLEHAAKNGATSYYISAGWLNGYKESVLKDLSTLLSMQGFKVVFKPSAGHSSANLTISG